MKPTARVPFLTRLASRYAARHRAQTVRAILGLFVVTIVVVMGLGLGESIAGSLEAEALSRYGPIDVEVRGQEPFNASLVGDLLRDPRVRALGPQGAATLAVTGAVAHPAKKLLEAYATIRGVSSAEAATLGPLKSPDGRALAEPRAGEVVLAEGLASRLEARVGDTIVLRAPIPGSFPDPEFTTQNYTGVTGLPGPLAQSHTLSVEADALGFAVLVQWADAAGPLSIEARSPGGRTFGNSSESAPLRLVVPPPIEPGLWTFTLSADRPTPYVATAAAIYPPPTLRSGVGVITAKVSAIAAGEGRAGLTWRPVALVPLADLQEATGMSGKANRALFAAPRDPQAVVSAMEAALPGGNETYEVNAIKADAIAEAEEAGAETTGFLLFMGAFTLVAAMMLAFALFSSLVEERRAELGIMRALGLTRGEVALSMTIEGGLYAALAAIVGLVLGFVLLAGLIAGIAWFSAANDGPPFSLHTSAGTIATAFAIGTGVPLATIGLASLRFARLDPARAIRGIPDDPRGRKRVGVVVAAVLLAAGLLLSLDHHLRLVGIPIAIAAVAVAFATRGRTKVAIAVAAAGVAEVAWTLYAFDTWPVDFGELDPILTLTRGAILALGLSALAVASTVPYDAVAKRFSSRSPFVALRYLASRRRAAGLTMGMISLVVVVVTVMGTLFSMFTSTIPNDEAGYTVIGESPLRLSDLPKPIPADVAALVERTDIAIRHFEIAPVNFTRNGEAIGPDWMQSFIGIDAEFAAANRYATVKRAPQYATDRAAWDAVAQGDAVIFPSWASEEDGPFAGDTITIKTALGAEREYVVAATVRANAAGGVFASIEHVRGMGFPSGSFIFVRTAEGADASRVAHRLTDEMGEEGLTFVSVEEEVAEITAGIRAVILVFESFLALGLIVGLAATSFLASRAVHERMRDIGTLRALGFEEKDVRRAFIIESTATAGIGLAIGVAVGLLVANAVWWREARDEGIPFSPPLLVLALFAVAVLGLAAWASRGPAKRAAALPPAIAVRYVE